MDVSIVRREGWNNPNLHFIWWLQPSMSTNDSTSIKATLQLKISNCGIIPPPSWIPRYFTPHCSSVGGSSSNIPCFLNRSLGLCCNEIHTFISCTSSAFYVSYILYHDTICEMRITAVNCFSSAQVQLCPKSLCWCHVTSSEGFSLQIFRIQNFIAELGLLKGRSSLHCTVQQCPNY